MRTDELKLLVIMKVGGWHPDGYRFDGHATVAQLGLEPGIDRHGKVLREIVLHQRDTTWDILWDVTMANEGVPTSGWRHDSGCVCEDCALGYHHEYHDGGYDIVRPDGRLIARVRKDDVGNTFIVQ